MKTQTISRATLILLAASATLLFTGCSVADGADVNGVVSPKVVNNNTNTSPTTSNNQQTENQDDDNVVSKVSEALKTEYLNAINAARADTQDCGSQGIFDPAPAVTWSNRLGNAAFEHSYDMANSDTFSHTGSGTATDITAKDQSLGRGSKFSERIENQGYIYYRTIGENIAAGHVTAQDAVNAWLESDHHCANLMSPKYSEVGMALVEKDGTDFGYYWSQEFGGQ
jgi:uncharacterized protein YkwD